jgi:signal transduction histidine kinase
LHTSALAQRIAALATPKGALPSLDSQFLRPVSFRMTVVPSREPRPLRVLLLEDRADDEVLLRHNLRESYGLTLARVDSAAGMRRELEDSSGWDVIVSDFDMRGFTALDALQILHDDGRDLPFIIVSGTMTDAMAVNAMRAGAHDYVMKDNLHRLKPAIERELQEAERRRALRLAEAERDRLLARERELREATEAAARSKDEFLTVLSHELRTPLTCIMGWTRVLQLRQDLDPSVVQALESIGRSGRSLTRQIEELLDLSAILSGRLHLQVRTLDFSAVVQAAVDSVAAAAREKEVAIDAAVTGVCLIDGDPDRLSQIVLNLLTNAVKFTPANGRISISLRRSPVEATLVVHDSGIGIPPDFLGCVFDRFRQADGSVSRAFGGLGIGLSIVRHLTEMHGGHVSAESDGPGQGAVFTVHLPATLAAGRMAAGLMPDPAAMRGRTVLLVEADASERHIVRTALEHCGAAVVSVPTAMAAIQTLNWADADVLISDLDLAIRNRLIVDVRRCRSGDIPALALSADAGPGEGQRALAAGFTACLAKPVTVQGLLSSVLDLLKPHAGAVRS